MNPIALSYGAATLIAFLLAAASGRHLTIKLALILVLAWAGCNVAVALNGYGRAPIIIPSFDAVLGTITGGLALANRNRLAAGVFALFGAEVLLWWAALSMHSQGSYWCYLCANLMFLTQVALVGEEGGRAYLADRSGLRHAGAHLRPSSG